MSHTPTATGTSSRPARAIAWFVGLRCSCPGCFPAVTLIRMTTMGSHR